MEHDIPLITTIVAGLGLAAILGAIANRFRISPLVGYLLAGVIIGPATPGYVADLKLAPELAEIGVILLMFGVGLHFSLRDLLSVRTIAIPGAIGQIAIATAMGAGLAWWFGWSAGAGLVFGLALSVASTVVLLRALQERRLVETERGRIAVGWLIVEDLAMVLALVLIPALADAFGEGGGQGSPVAADIFLAVGVTLIKVVAFVGLMLLIGRRFIPWLLHRIVHGGSRELFRLSVLAIALGVAFGASALFGVSFALGAFFAGMILGESPLSQRAAEETLPLRDAFAVLFFVSVGMLFDPAILVARPGEVLATLLVILVGKSLAAFLIVLAFRRPLRTALTISASLAQIGEFSFILATLGVSLKLLPPEGQSLILASAMISILLNPIIFSLLDRLERPASASSSIKDAAPVDETGGLVRTQLSGHAVIVGFGRVGSLVGAEIERSGRPFLVIEENADLLEPLRTKGIETIAGNAIQKDLLAAANVAAAHWLFVAIPQAFEVGQIVEEARRSNPGLAIIARAHSDAEVDHLKRRGASIVIMGEREIAHAMIAYALAGDASAPSEAGAIVPSINRGNAVPFRHGEA